MAESVVQHMRNCMCRAQTATTGRQLVNVKENIKFDVNVSEMQNPVDLLMADSTLEREHSKSVFNSKECLITETRERQKYCLITEPRKGHFFSNIYQKRNRNKKN